VFAWLKRLASKDRPAPKEDPLALTPAEEAAYEQVREAYEAEQEGRPPPPRPLPDSPDAPDAAWATALGLPVERLAHAAVSLTGEERRVADAVLGHFDTHRPGPASFPAISLQAVELARDPDVDLAKLARLIGLDAALSAGVLVLANSPVFRGVDKIETPRQAIGRLGTAEVARLVAALSTRSLFQPQVRAEFETFGPSWNRLFYHSAVVARTAASLAEARKLPGAEHAFVGGMLHDVGKSIALRSVAALTLEGQIRLPPVESLGRILHEVHVEVGRAVHEEWKLPDHLTTLAARHHEPVVPREPALAALHLVRLTSALQLLAEAPDLNPGAPAEALDSARALGLGPARVQALALELVESGEWVRLLFGEETGGPAAAH
jgi:putative nucleotidyltransferase with HDIG domain